MRLELTPVSTINHITPHDTKKKKAVSETQNLSNTHTHTLLYTYQISKKGKADQSKHTPGKRHKNPL